MHNESDDEGPADSPPDNEEDFNEPPHKIGDVIEQCGVRRVVTGLRRSKGGHFWAIDTSAEPLAEEQGYVTRDQSLGFKVEHFPPPFVGRGTCREVTKLSAADWDFRELLKRPDHEKRVALFHELARESARMREVCRVLERYRSTDAEENEKKAAVDRLEWAAKDKVAECAHTLGAFEKEINGREPTADESAKLQRLNDELEAARRAAANASGEASFVAIESCFRDGRQAFRDADEFLQKRFASWPYGVRGVLTEWIAKDVPWTQLPDSETKETLDKLEAREKQRGENKRQSLGFSDLPGDGPDWPFGYPIQFATDPDNRGQFGQPSYDYNDGITGRPVLTLRGNGSDAPRILSESLELCICLNFRDEEILDALQQWLDNKRASLPESLGEFKKSAKRPAVKMKSNNVDAALLALAALRLRAAMKPLEAVAEFDRLYFPEEKARKPDASNLAKRAEIAVEWQTHFLRYCPLDSAGPVNRGMGQYDRECPLCYNVEKFTLEPHKLPRWNSDFRCEVCDHRDRLGWTGAAWVRVEIDHSGEGVRVRWPGSDWVVVD